jgi:hypothetical protein
MPRFLCVSDLDGTYLESNGNLPSNSEKFLSFLNDGNAIFAVATSRSPHNVLNMFSHLETELLGICSDGATNLIFRDQGWHILSEQLIPTNIAETLLERVLVCDIPKELFFFTGAEFDFGIFHYSPCGARESLAIMQSILDDGRPILHVDDVSISGRTSITKSLRAISWLDMDENIKHDYEALALTDLEYKINVLQYPEVRYPPYSWLDIVSEEVNKGVALKVLVDSLWFTRPVIFALGNAKNDLGLFDEADFSYCPSNAAVDVKRVATKVLPAPNGEAFLVSVMEELDNSLLRRLK